MSNESQVTATATQCAAPEPKGITPSLEEVRALAATGEYRRVPVMRELFSDRFTTIEAMRRLRSASNHCFLFESAEADLRWGRYSFLGFSPSAEVTCVNGELTVTRGVETATPQVERAHVEHPGDALRELLAAHKSPQLPGFPPFCCGLVGYFSYDYLKYAEPALRRTEGERANEDFLDMDLMLFDRVIAFDSYRQKVALVASVDLGEPAGPAGTPGTASASGTAGEPGPAGETAPASDLAAAYAAAAAQIDQMQAILEGGQKHFFAPLRLGRPLAPLYDEKRFCGMVREAQRRIYEGDIFQVVLSDPMVAPAEGSLFDAYRVLRSANPSPYMVFMTSDDVEVAAASPETLARLEAGKLYTYPLAGTRPRGATPEEDAELERGLLADQKELAEHNMLVDLGRNDIGRVAELGSVAVESYHDVLRFSHVMHLGSTVSGTLAAGRDAVDVIDSILPAGTLSGAPKLRACQIIGELEGQKRGIYGGAIGYLDFAGNLDTCIGIRLAYKKGGQVCVQSGAGIVADSVPEREFAECRNKARAVVAALEQAEGGLA